MGGLLPMPPSASYCIQRSDSMTSAAPRKRRIAMSRGAKRPEFWAPNVDTPLAARPAPTVATPAATMPSLINERRFDFFLNIDSERSIVYLLFLGVLQFSYTVSPIFEEQTSCHPGTCKYVKLLFGLQGTFR